MPFHVVSAELAAALAGRSVSCRRGQVLLAAWSRTGLKTFGNLVWLADRRTCQRTGRLHSLPCPRLGWP